MKKAFTLVELLVVVVIISILASIVFKIASVGEDTQKRNITAARMQRLENAISGYFAAYGSYPPVPLQGRSRNIFTRVNGHGIQQIDDSAATDLDWKRVEAACRSQPVAAAFPFSSESYDRVRAISEMVVTRHNQGVEGYEDSRFGSYFDALENPANLMGKRNEAKWTEVQLFQFGLISFLLPRYLVMMGHGGTSAEMGSTSTIYDDFAQWSGNNSMPSKFEDGSAYRNWQALNNDVCKRDKAYLVELLPTQAVTARWIANLEGVLSADYLPKSTLYGVDFTGASTGNLDVKHPEKIKLFSASDGRGESGASNSGQYVLNHITCEDGWRRELYYYSQPPYQSYRLWSAGANGKTFPPWIPEEDLDAGDLRQYKESVLQWLSDDIVHMSN